MTTHIGTLSTEIELTSEPAPGLTNQAGLPALDERDRVQKLLQRQRSIAARTRAEGFDE